MTVHVNPVGQQETIKGVKRLRFRQADKRPKKFAYRRCHKNFHSKYKGSNGPIETMLTNNFRRSIHHYRK